MLGKIEGRRRRGTIEDDMVGWHHRLNGHEFEQALGVGDGQGGLAFCGSWRLKELDMTERLHFSWKKSYDQPRQHIKKQRHYFANQVPSHQSYGFSSSPVWM